MIIDLSHCEIIHEMDQDPDIVPDNAGYMVTPHLTNEIQVVMLAAEVSEARRDELKNSHFQSKLLKCVKLYSENDIFIVPLSSLYGPYFAVYTKY